MGANQNDHRGEWRACIVNYGMGNLESVSNALRFLGFDALVSSEPKVVESADVYILPGVGAFGEAMLRLHTLGLIEPLVEQVTERRKPFLGICLGMQLLAEDSLEHGFNEGLGLIKGHVRPISRDTGVRVPHVGWSETKFSASDLLFRRIDPGSCFYFDHSFYLECDDSLVVATCHYGAEFPAAIRKDNIVATQFHPEKSQRVGLKMLRNFMNLCSDRYGDKRAEKSITGASHGSQLKDGT